MSVFEGNHTLNPLIFIFEHYTVENPITLNYCIFFVKSTDFCTAVARGRKNKIYTV